MRMVIAEKEFVTADRIGRLARTLGHRHEWVCSPQEALVSLEESPCDLMVLSAQLCGMRAGDLIFRLRQVQSSLALVVTTDRNCLALEREVRGHGIICYLIKPLILSELASAIRHTASQIPAIHKENCHEETSTGI